jgi:hypothetical protein
MTNPIKTENEKQIKEFLVTSGCSKMAVDSILSERNYQNKTWNPQTTASGGDHSEIEFLVFIQDYLNEAIHIVSRIKEPDASNNAADTYRKIITMALGCSEKNNWLHELEKNDYTQHKVNLVASLGFIQHLINKALESDYTGFHSSTRMYISQIFWVGVHTMSTNDDFCPLR